MHAACGDFFQGTFWKAVHVEHMKGVVAGILVIRNHWGPSIFSHIFSSCEAKHLLLYPIALEDLLPLQV